MMPLQLGDGKGHFVAREEWKLLGNERNALSALESSHREIRGVAGARNALKRKILFRA
jgi:hypothetical protein